MDKTIKPTLDRLSVPSLRQLIAEIDERAGAALDILDEDDNDTHGELRDGLNDLQALISTWQEQQGYI